MPHQYERDVKPYFARSDLLDQWDYINSIINQKIHEYQEKTSKFLGNTRNFKPLTSQKSAPDATANLLHPTVNDSEENPNALSELRDVLASRAKRDDPTDAQKELSDNENDSNEEDKDDDRYFLSDPLKKKRRSRSWRSHNRKPSQHSEKTTKITVTLDASNVSQKIPESSSVPILNLDVSYKKKYI